MAYTKYSLTPANNTATPPDGAPEGMLPSAVNDTMRDMMAQIRDCGDGIRDGTYTMTAPKITGGSISGVTFSGTQVTATNLTSGRVTYAGTSGVLQDDADFTFNGTTVTMANDASISGLTVGKGGGAVSSNTAVGASALAVNEAGGTDNTAIGYQAADSNTTGDNNVAVGSQALQANTTASNNTAVGYQAAYSNTTGTVNVAIGTSALYSNTTGSQNTAVGDGALQLNTTASFNTAVGRDAMEANTTGANNTALGWQALVSNTTASNNTAVGYQAGYSNTTGQYNALFGYQAGYTNSTSSKNVCIGYQAGYTANTTGDAYNTFVGYSAGYLTSTGTINAYVGNGAGQLMTTGSKNTILGGYSGNQDGLDIRTASNYIVLSDGDGNPRAYWTNNGVAFTNASVTDAEALVITNSQATRPYGVNIKFSGATPNDTTRYFLSCEDTTNAKCFIYSSGTVTNRTGTYNTISDQKIKQDIVDASSQWDDIKSVRFRKYRLIDDVKANPDAPYLLGVVAQELEQTSPALIDNCEDKNGEITKGVKTSVLLMKAAKALQEAMERIETLEAKVQQLENK
jgi:hypothetical protein